jgi:hypothetical protein
LKRTKKRTLKILFFSTSTVQSKNEGAPLTYFKKKLREEKKRKKIKEKWPTSCAD